MIAGDALLEAYEAHRDHLFGYALALTRDPEAADEVFQEVGVAMVEQARKGVEVDRFSKWAREIVRRRVAEHFRRRSRIRQRERPLEGIIERAFAESEPRQDEGRARRAALLECIPFLPKRRRELIEARYLGRKSIREIARVLSWSEGAVKAALWKARRDLFERLEARRAGREDRGGFGPRAGNEAVFLEEIP